MVYNVLFCIPHIVPELQGEPKDIAREKCKLAVDKVSFILQSNQTLT